MFLIIKGKCLCEIMVEGLQVERYSVNTRHCYVSAMKIMLTSCAFFAEINRELFLICFIYVWFTG